MSLTVACKNVSSFNIIFVNSTVAGNGSPLILLCVHSKKFEPLVIAFSIISLAFSEDNLPSGCFSGEISQGPYVKNSSIFLTLNISKMAGLPEVNFHVGGLSVIKAS